MKRYKLLNKSDIIPNHKYDAIVCYPYPSKNRNRMFEPVYYDQYQQWCGTDKDIIAIVDESIISVLLECNPDRAYEILQGGYEDDGLYNDIISMTYNLSITSAE